MAVLPSLWFGLHCSPNTARAAVLVGADKNGFRLESSWNPKVLAVWEILSQDRLELMTNFGSRVSIWKATACHAHGWEAGSAYWLEGWVEFWTFHHQIVYTWYPKFAIPKHKINNPLMHLIEKVESLYSVAKWIARPLMNFRYINWVLSNTIHG